MFYLGMVHSMKERMEVENDPEREMECLEVERKGRKTS
jgi:hypothetical protein